MPFDDVPRMSRLDLAGRRVFLRADLDVRTSGAGRLVSAAPLARLESALLRLRAADCKVVVAGHWRPRDTAAAGAMAEWLAALVGAPVVGLGRDFPSEIGKLAAGELALAPNLALFTDERRNDARFATRIARSVDVYLSEAPAAAREVRASNVALPRLLPARAVGPALGRDLDMADEFLDATPPFTAIVGGAGVRRKEPLLRALVQRVDALLLAGVVGNTFLVASGWEPRSTWHESDAVETARQLLDAAHARGVRLLLPTDALALAARAGGGFQARALGALAPEEALLDIGPETRRAFVEAIRASSTVLWNGVLGRGDSDATLAGTRAVLDAAVAAPFAGVLGSQSAARAAELGLASKFRHVAGSGDGALELFAGGALPGIESLRAAPRDEATRPHAPTS